MIPTLRNLGLALLTATLIGGSSQATSILIDLGSDESFRGASVTSPDSNGNHWTSVWSGAFYSDLVDTTGTPTTVDFGFSSAPGTDYFNGPSGATQDPAATVYNAAALGDLGINEAVYDYYVSSTFQIQMLDTSKTYDLTFFGSHKFNNDNTTRYTVYTDGSFSTPVASVDLLVGVNADHNQDTVATLSGVAPQPDGIIYVGFEGATGGNGYLNALQITEVIPEPSTAALMIIASLFVSRPTRR